MKSLTSIVKYTVMAQNYLKTVVNSDISDMVFNEEKFVETGN